MEADEVAREVELLRRVGQGDQAAFAQIYQRYAGVLFATAFRILNDQAAAEDVLQDVFLQIWDKAALYDGTRGKPLTWAITLVRNKAIDRLRTAQRRQRMRDELEQEKQMVAKFDDRDSITEIDAHEKGRLVREAIMQLPQAQREAIELAFFSGLTQSEIAEQLKEPLGTIKARIRRGLLKLRETLGPAL